MEISDDMNFYWENEMLPFEEDFCHEFKCHRDLAVEDLPPWTQENPNVTRRSVSRSLNAFLNTGQGGTVYLGVSDGGRIKGFFLTLFQRDHISVNLDNLMKRYKPEVDVSRYSIQFVPVISRSILPAEADLMCHQINQDNTTFSTEDRLRNHLCQSYARCWCDVLAKKLLSRKPNAIPKFVIKIHIKAWDSSTMLWNNILPEVNLHPMHTNEEGLVFMRTLAGVKPCDDQDIVNITMKDMKDIYQMRIEKIKRKIARIKKT
ncbi:uncharacterized protein LOC115224808 [Argonauta hians]